MFAPKYRRKVFYEANRLEIGKILRDLCNRKDVNIITAEVCSDHIHMFVEIPPIIEKNLDELKKLELIPFIEAVRKNYQHLW